MKPVIFNRHHILLHGDCIEAMNYLLDSDFRMDSIVCDPPYNLDSIVKRFAKTTRDTGGVVVERMVTRADGLARVARGFMGQAWDNDIAMHPETWVPAFDLLKPGGYMLVFGGTRTFHRIACAIEDAGFEIKDCLMWLYGSGFPKDHKPGVEGFEGWGTALKPAWEPIIMARKPFKGTIADNVREFGTGCINVDGCRIELPEGDPLEAGIEGRDRRVIDTGLTEGAWGFKAVDRPAGLPRWPANVIHDGSEEIEAGFAEYGNHQACKPPSKATPEGKILGGKRSQGNLPADSGYISRYFYCAKAGPRDRIYRCEDCKTSIWKSEFPQHQHGHVKDDGKPDYRHITSHPTCKPLSLMQYLVRLVTPPGGMVLDQFAGSGTTLQAARAEGFFSVGVEKEDAYIQDILRRLKG